MKYKTGDLSKILGVSANTIRRFTEKGYLSPDINTDNQYRFFGDEDVEKMVYISKYRKIGFGHDEIAEILSSDIVKNRALYRQKKDELDKEIKRLQSIRHMLKDDITMMDSIGQYGDSFFEMQSVGLYYVTYKDASRIKGESDRHKQLHRFIYEFPEIEYVYIIRKENLLKKRFACEEAVSVRSRWAEKHDIVFEGTAVEHYPEMHSVCRIIRLPLDLMTDGKEQQKIQEDLLREYYTYMEEHGYRPAGDAVGVKIGFSKEEGRDMQYVVLGIPVEKVDE